MVLRNMPKLLQLHNNSDMYWIDYISKHSSCLKNTYFIKSSTKFNINIISNIKLKLDTGCKF